jgi:division protein CdvB (Snf7/Vps24/ESCRT-III family)
MINNQLVQLRMASFFKNWTKHHQKGIREKAKETLRIHGPKPRIEIGNSTIELQISKLDNKIADSKDREVCLFNRIVNAIQSHNVITAKILSSELANVRHNQRILNQARRTLEQVSIRNSTVSDMLEIMETLKPAIQPVKGLKSDITNLQPDIGKEISYVQMITNSVMSEANQNYEMNIDIAYSGNGLENDIDQIIAEASHRVDE